MPADPAIEAAATELCLLRMYGCIVPKFLHRWCVLQLAEQDAQSWRTAMEDATAAIRAYLAAQPKSATKE